MSGIPINVEDASTRQFAVSSCQERSRTISESETIKGIEQGCRKLKLVHRRIGFLETSGHGWFHEAEVPSDLSLGRTSPHHITRMFAHWREPALPTEFD